MSHRRSRPPLLVGVTAALVAALLVTPIAAPLAIPRAAAAGPVSGAIGLGGGLSGSVDERTGLFSVSVPVVSVAGPGSAGVTWSLVWDQGRAVDGLDRSGFGPGWSLGVSFIDPATPVTVYPANGGAYTAGGTYPSGLQNYPLQDLVFRRTSGEFAFELSYDDGRVDSFDDNGNLVARTDRFGNRTQLTWQPLPGGRWAPTSIVDGYGLTTTFTYTPTSVEVSAPARSDGVVATTTITLDDERRVSSVTDPSNATAHFEYSEVSGSTVPLLTSVVSASQAHTRITYQDFGAQPGLTAVQSVVITDSSGTVMGPARLFSMNPVQNENDHNYTGYPQYHGATTDQLFVSGDADYFYTTAILSCVVPQLPVPESCPGSPLSTVSRYDSQHRLVARTVLAGQVTVQHQTSTYPPVRASNLDPNYARPTGTSVTYSATSSSAGISAASGSRTVTAGRHYDDHGRLKESTDETGTTTKIAYDDAYGLITSVTITGADGSRSETTNVLSADGKTINNATTAYAAPGQPLTARSMTSYLYDAAGQPTQRTMTWAPGAKPAGDSGGPDTVTTRFDTAVDFTARTRTITTTTAAGTPAAAGSTTVVDLVTGQPVRSTDPLGRIVSYTYDAAGRQASRTTPDGLTTRTTYAAATAATPAARTDSTADGRIALTTYDALGRVVRVTDNVSDQAFTGSPTARQVSAHSYSLDGTTITATDQHGRTITTKLDVLGRQVHQLGATGITHATAYNDVAHTTTQTAAAAGSASPDATRTTTYDDGNRSVSVQREYSDGTADPTQTTGHDGLGRVTAQTSDDLTLDYTYLGAGGATTAQTANPQDPGTFPGEPLDLTNTVALGGQQTTSARQHQDQGAPSEGTRLTYDAAGRVATSTDPNGRTTSYTYHADGTVATRTTPSGTVVTDSYDPVSGRLTSVIAQPSDGPEVTLTHTYVPAGVPGAGRVHTISDGTDTVTLGYDADGHVVSRSYSDGTATFATYTDTGLLDTTTDVTGAVTTYHYYTDGQLKSATQTRGTTVLASVTYTYDAMSRVHTTTRSNGVTTTNAWTPRNQLHTQRTTTGSGALIEEHAYTYDNHGNVATRTDTHPAVSSTPTTAGTWTTAYRYDAYDRLIGSATYAGSEASGQPSTSTTYTLNAAGDVVDIATDSSTTTNTIDAAGQLTAQTTDGTVVNQTFDGDGRVTQSLNGSAMSYDAFDRMLTATRAGTSATYTYWPDGTRRSTTTTSTAQAAGVCDQAIAEAGTGQGTFGGYELVQAPAVGGSGSQVVVGTAGSDRLLGGSGNDVLCGLDGDDVLLGGSGDDHLDGGAGSDLLQAGSGHDHLDGAAGSDRLFGGSGNDTLSNGEVINGGSGENQSAPAPTVDTSTQTFHYGTDGTLVNDTTADATTGATATTASYLLTAGREARTLQPGTTTVGAVADGAPAPVTVGPGTGYVLRDRHSSVTALVDSNAAVTNTYHYADYGLPALPDGQRQAQSAPAPGGQHNLFQYTGATPTSSMTDATTGLLLLPARSYDPTQGRFTTRDTANVFNHYQGFSTNPIVYVDPTGHFSLEDLLIDIGMAIVFAVAAIASGGAAIAALPAVIGAEVGAVTASTIATTVALAVTAVASATGASASALKAADDIDDAVSGKHFLSNDQRSALGSVQLAAGVVAAFSGITAALGAAEAAAEGAAAGAEDAAQNADDFLADPDDETEEAHKPNAIVEGEESDPESTDSNATDMDDSGVVASYLENDAVSGSDSILDGLSGRAAEPRPVTPSASRPISIQQNVLRAALGTGDLNASDAAVINADRGLTASLNASEAADEALSGSYGADVARSTGTSPVLSAMNGNWLEEADEFGVDRYLNDITANLNADDRITFLQYFDEMLPSSSSSE